MAHLNINSVNNNFEYLVKLFCNNVDLLMVSKIKRD